MWKISGSWATRAQGAGARGAMHVLGEGLGTRALPLSTYPLKFTLYSWGLRRAPIGEVDDSGRLRLQAAGSAGGAVERHLQAAQMPGMRQTRCRGATTTSQLERQRAQAAAGVRGVRLLLSGVEEGEGLAAHLALTEPAESVCARASAGGHKIAQGCSAARRTWLP